MQSTNVTIHQVLQSREPEKYLNTNLCNRSRPNRLNFKEIKNLIKALAELSLHDPPNNFDWRGRSLIAQRNKPFHPGRRRQIGFAENLSCLVNKG